MSRDLVFEGAMVTIAAGPKEDGQRKLRLEVTTMGGHVTLFLTRDEAGELAAELRHRVDRM